MCGRKQLQHCESLGFASDAVVFNCTPAARTILVIQDTKLARGKEIKKDRFSEKGVDYIVLPSKEGKIELGRLMDGLGQLNITSLLIEGGSRVFQAALAEKIIDKAIIFYGPKILGGNDGIPIFAGAGPEKMADSIRIKDLAVERFGDDIMVSGYPVYPATGA